MLRCVLRDLAAIEHGGAMHVNLMTTMMRRKN
jgi:hypothetical protein